MVIKPSKSSDTYYVTQLCNTTKKYIQSLPADSRYLSTDGWCVHKSVLPNVIKKAKLTGFHNILDYDCVDSATKASIDAILGKSKLKVIPTTDSPYSTLYLLPTAPISIVKAAWRTLSLELHPDHGGDQEKFIKVKAAYEAIINSDIRRNTSK